MSTFRRVFDAIKLAPALAGVDLDFGEDRVYFTDQAPRVVLVPPDGETFDGPGGYTADSVNNPRILWHRVASAQIFCHAISNLPDATPEDHTEAVEELIQLVIQALHAQMFTGYRYLPVSIEWRKNEGETLKYGRVAVLLIEFRFAVTLPKSNEIAVTDTPFSFEVDPIPGGP